MQEIKCPNCGAVFQVDEQSYESIARQVRNEEFAKELHERAEQFEKEKAIAIKLAQTETAGELNEQLSKKDAKITELEAKISAADNKAKLDVNEAVSAKEKEIIAKDNEISDLKAKLSMMETEMKLAVNEAVTKKDKEISDQKEKIALLL